MAQLNVAREPSMDEILASIRKIIENNEPGPAGSSARQPFEDDAEDEIELTIDSEIEAAAFGAADEPVVPVMPSSAAAPDERAEASSPLSLADVAARVRAASERHAVNHGPREQPGMAPVRAPQESPVITSPMAAVSVPMSLAADAAEESSESAASFTAVAAAPAAAEPPATPQPPASVGESPEADNPMAAIVSPAVSRQVARAFDDLAHAVEHGPRRSFDEIAEAMLRPMLQEWLDDNLPTLVERLVREEIERVARGTRR
ncbi:PopZ family protein [Sinorhizobium saheli]|uniref:Pole-organizing protein PopZ n=1 Tax=Sinorhizobium saheli TaxID=36856 RepID=A0A178YEY9_SINSA|nr:PopZ family protein [Sinorhizobium saheli]MQW87162.1 DUF2497 domain-containing protein [Sinorhizobium saheli]OAP45405.1 hypothetical protein ATB98_26375 [Sinorhizobium saheli]